jgi:DNA-binding IclR family transcriptional regulator
MERPVRASVLNARPRPRAPSKTSVEGFGSPDSRRYTVQALNRAIDVLMAFSEQSPALTLGEVSARTGLSKPTAFRLLATLRNRGLIRQDPGSGKYELGFSMLALAAVRARQANVRDRAVRVMRNIRDAVNETVVLSVREGDSRVHVDQVEGRHPFRRIASPGERAPLYAGAASKVLLAALSDGEVDDYLRRVPLVPLSTTTVTNRARLRKELALIRQRDYAQGLNERNLGGAGVAAPVRDHTGCVVAVLHVSVPITRYTSRVRALCVRAVREGAVALSRELGDRAAGGARGSA